MTQLPITTDERDAEIARLEAKGHVVLDIYNPRNHLCEHLAPKVALLKAVFGIDDSGRLTRPPPPKAFGQQVFEYIMGGRVREQRARRPMLAPPLPNGLRTLTEAARKLRCSISTLNAHVVSGALRYVAVGHGRERMRKMFTDADLDTFIANRTRKDIPCPSAATRARRSGSTDSKSEVVSFSGLQRRRRNARPKE
jgi:hypothetical protein